MADSPSRADVADDPARDTARVLGGSAATAVGAADRTVHRDAGGCIRSWSTGRRRRTGDLLLLTVDEQVDVQLCADIGVRWIATNHPAQVRDWLVTV